MIGLHTQNRLGLTQLVILSVVWWSWSVSVGVQGENAGDGGCCRRPVECYECDSRTSSNCHDPFNMTRDSVHVRRCNDLCYKLKHRVGDRFYYIRGCADSLKKLYNIKKTDVCYSTRSKDGGNLCFCDQELCNAAGPIINLYSSSPFFHIVYLSQSLLVAMLSYFYH